MLFYNDECDLVDDDQYDLFTLTTQIQRHTNAFRRRREEAAPSCIPSACGSAPERPRQH